MGLGWAVNNPERVERLILMSTWAWLPPCNVPESVFGRLLQMVRTPEFGDALLLGYNFFVEGFMPMCFARKEIISPQLMDAYRAPFPDYVSRVPTLVVQDIPTHRKHPSYASMKDIEQKLSRLNVPTCLIWGDRDNVLEAPRYVSIWKAIFEHSEVHIIKRAGHFLQEDAPDEVTEVINDFLSRSS